MQTDCLYHQRWISSGKIFSHLQCLSCAWAVYWGSRSWRQLRSVPHHSSRLEELQMHTLLSASQRCICTGLLPSSDWQWCTLQMSLGRQTSTLWYPRCNLWKAGGLPLVRETRDRHQLLPVFGGGLRRITRIWALHPGHAHGWTLQLIFALWALDLSYYWDLLGWLLSDQGEPGVFLVRSNCKLWGWLLFRTAPEGTPKRVAIGHLSLQESKERNLKRALDQNVLRPSRALIRALYSHNCSCNC